MSRHCVFKWSEQDFTMREFVDIFSHRLPMVIFITAGWQGKDEDHTFSGDEVYRIGAVKKQPRIIAKHPSGYFVSIPTTIKKKVDILFPDGNVTKSARISDLVDALRYQNSGTLEMMFENDDKISFSFGPDEGAEINFGKMTVIDTYDERYLVGHSVCEGKVYSLVMPLPIPVYMTIQLAPAVGIVGGTTEDFLKVLADIEDQMKDGIMQVEDYDEIMLFPHDISGRDYEFIQPCSRDPTLSSTPRWKMDLRDMTTSPAYASAGDQGTVKPTLQARARNKVHVPPKNKKAPLRSPFPLPSTHTETHELTQKSLESCLADGPPRLSVTPFNRPMLPFFPKPSLGTGTRNTPRPLPQRRPSKSGTASTTPRSPASSEAANTSCENSPLQVKPVSPSNSATSSNEFNNIRDVASDVRTLTPEQLAQCMRMLKIAEPCICAFREKDVDGEILASIDQSILIDEFQFGRFDAVKLMKFAKDGYRPNVARTSAEKEQY